MLKRIAARNFRGFLALDASVDRVTAFLGPNSSGKTTVLQAVRLACDLLRLGLETDYLRGLTLRDGRDWVIVTHGAMLGNHARYLPLADWRALFVDQVVEATTRLELTLQFEDTDKIRAIHVSIGGTHNEQLVFDVLVDAPELVAAVQGLAKRSPVLVQQLTAFVEQHAPVAVLVPPFYGTVRDEEYRSRAVIDRLLGSGDQSHVVRNLVSGLDADQYERLNSFLDDTIGARLTYRTSGDALQTESPLRVRFRDSNGDIELSAAGAGLVNLVALYSALSRWRGESQRRPILFLVDEPEAHLHPRLQAESAERFGRLVTREFGAQLLLATHSVDIVNRLSTTGALLLRCDRTAQPSIVALESDSALFEDVAAWADLTPYTAINFLASRRVLFCEGDDEIEILPRMARVYFRNDPKRAAAFSRWALVRLQGATNDGIASLLARLVRNEVVRARAKVGKFEVVVVLDRDHAREPGIHRAEVDGIGETRAVWSQHSLESLVLEPAVLATWVRAFAGEAAPPDLPERVRAAIATADADDKLNDSASDQLAVASMGHGAMSTSDRIHAMERAREQVRRSPATWQRGKDRARVILTELRSGIGVPSRNQFPTDIVRLVCRVDPNRIGEASAAVPTELAQLLDLLARI